MEPASKRLRTCSMPDLRLLFQTASPLKRPPYVEQQSAEDEQAHDDEDDDDDGDDEGDEYDDEGDDADGEFGDDEESELGNGSDEEVNEYENMLESMRDVLVSSARSPSPLKSIRSAANTAQSMEWDPVGDTAAPIDDEDGTKPDEGGRTSELSNLNEDWDSGDGEEDGEDKTDKEEEEESVFQRLEESRMALETELGFDKFMRVYKYLQAVQENEDESENADVGSAAEISELLGDKEHLYPKILYLVIADSAYTEDNQ